MFTAKWIEPGQDLTDALTVREQVFVREQHFCDPDRDAHDATARHVVVYQDDNPTNPGTGTPVATGRIFLLPDNAAKLGRFAVLADYRGRGYGDLVIKMLLRAGLDAGREKFYITAQLDKVGFYARYGFVHAGETWFMEEHAPHVEMAAAAERVRFPSQCK